MKRKSKSAKAKLTKKLDDVIREIIRVRSNDTCQRCGMKVYGSNSQPSHVLAKGNGANWRRFDLLNIKLLCNACHRWWHLNPLQAKEWFKKKFSAQYMYLWPNRNKIKGYKENELAKMLAECKQKLKELKEGEK